MDTRKIVRVERLIEMWDSDGHDTRDLQAFLDDIVAERNMNKQSAPTTANSESAQN